MMEVDRAGGLIMVVRQVKQLSKQLSSRQRVKHGAHSRG